MSKLIPTHISRQFKKTESSDFPGVVIPLASAQRHASLTGSEKIDLEKNGAESPTSEEEKGRSPSNSAYDSHTIEGLRAELEVDHATPGPSAMYDRKSKLINRAIQDMGMGRYQWELFVLCGFGWFADNFWLQGVALVLPQLAKEFDLAETTVRYTTFSLFIGLTIGASFWGVASDIIGRRLAFNSTLFIGALFGTAVGGADKWITVCALFACLGVGVGGNLPVDGALFLEFLPFASGNLLTLLSVWWPVGSLVASLIAWGLIPNFSCSGDASCSLEPNNPDCCTKSNNMGWRYFTFTLGGITFVQWILRFLVFQMFESPKFLLSKGRQSEAVAVVHGLAYKNKKKTWLTEEILNEVGGYQDAGENTKLSNMEILKRTANKFSTQRIGPLFNNWKLGLTTVLLWIMWATIGMGYPLFNGFLPQYLSKNGAGEAVSTNITYRNYAITTVVGVPGSILAYWTVDIKYIGRKGTMAIASLITGIFLFLFTTSTSSDFQLAFTCLVAFFQNIMYGVLYAYTPEVFPAPQRGTGTGIASTFNRIGGFCAPLVAIFAGRADPKAPIYASGALILVAFVCMCALPIETRGKQSL